jgi:hypothetical protein
MAAQRERSRRKEKREQKMRFMSVRDMRVRYDRSGVSIDAWATIAAAVICLNILMETTP